MHNLRIISHKYPGTDYEIYKENGIYTLWKNSDNVYKIYYNLHKFDDVVHAVSQILEESSDKNRIGDFLLDITQFIFGERRMIYNIELSSDNSISIRNNITRIEDFIDLITRVLKKID